MKSPRDKQSGPNTNYDTSPSLQTLAREVHQYMNRRESSSYRFYPGTEMVQYDYTSERRDLHTTNLIESTAHIIKGSLGAGVLSMHEAYMYGGLWTSLAMNIVIGLFVLYIMHMLVKTAQLMYGRLRVTRLSYPDLAEVAVATGPWRSARKLSKPFRYTVDMCLFFEMCGTCCVYQIMIAHTFRQALEGLKVDLSEFFIDIRLYILIITPCLIMLCLIRSLKFLAPFSMLADLFVGMCVLTTLYHSMRKVGDIKEVPAWKSPHGFVRFCGMCLYCTSGVAVALPVENNMRKPLYFRTVVECAMTIVIVLLCLTGFFGFWAWGETCRSPITNHMPHNEFTTILQFLLLMMLCTTFAVQFWVPFRIIWHYVGRRFKSKVQVWERFHRLLMALMITAVTMLFPNLIPVMVFIGHFFLGFIVFVFPAVIELLVTWPREHRKRQFRWVCFKDSCLIIIGLLLSTSSVYSVRG